MDCFVKVDWKSLAVMFFRLKIVSTREMSFLCLVSNCYSICERERGVESLEITIKGSHPIAS